MRWAHNNLLKEELTIILPNSLCKQISRTELFTRIRIVMSKCWINLIVAALKISLDAASKIIRLSMGIVSLISDPFKKHHNRYLKLGKLCQLSILSPIKSYWHALAVSRKVRVVGYVVFPLKKGNLGLSGRKPHSVQSLYLSKVTLVNTYTKELSWKAIWWRCTFKARFGNAQDLKLMDNGHSVNNGYWVDQTVSWKEGNLRKWSKILSP